mgnify:CR=1 FL=1|tara:strand:- start:1120 stop:1617 length:498 start_codon:yes stop_codon:yes gene_type:complete
MDWIGNFNFIQDSWIQEVLNTAGQARPRDWPASSAVESAEYAKAKEAGYDLNAVHWWVYEKNDVSFDIVDLPFIKGDYHWWITKLYPGQFMPVHTDPHTHERSCKRYWVPMQDYHPGHIFLYKDNIIINYKKGDVYAYDQEQDTHGAANIGHLPRLVLQVTEYVV